MIHPRRLKGSVGNIARYYGVGDYYTKGSAEHSEWGGRLAAELQLRGAVDTETFKALLAGQVAGQQLGRMRDGQREHHPGWDFAINAPKSVSIIALIYQDDKVLAAHERAVDMALNYLEEHASFRRRDEGKIVHESTGRLLWARFTEHASRELDPHLHTHVVVLNMTNREEGGQMVSLETRAMYAEQMVAGQVYRNELAHQLREQGWEVEFDPRRGLFEMRGVPQQMIDDMSQRAAQIDQHAAEHGFRGQAARRQSFYATRGPKQKIGLEELQTQWLERARPYEKDVGLAREEAGRVGDRDLTPDASTATRAMLFGIRQTENTEAVNNLGRLLGTGLASHVGEVRLRDIRPLVEEHEARQKLLHTRHDTGDDILTRGRTTRRSARMELALTHHLALAQDDVRPIGSADRLLAVLADAGLDPAQERAVVHMALSRDRVTGIHGVAGAGKSTLIKSLRDVAGSGSTLVALAPTSSAAANLGHTAEIESRTVASLLAGGGRGITDRHVLILDEAGQLGNRQALRVLEISRTTGARLILLGDNKQTGAIEQGKPFWLMQKLGLPTAELTETRRQETKAMKEAVTLARSGDYAASLSRLDKVTTGVDADALAKDLVSEWTRLRPENRARTNILVLDNASRLIVNSRIREALKREGSVAVEDHLLRVLTPAGLSPQEKQMARFYSGGQVVIFSRDIESLGIARDNEYRVLHATRDDHGRPIVRLVDEHGKLINWDPRLSRASQINVFNREERNLAEGDRIQWRLVSQALGLKNAERGTVERIEGNIATIRWDRGDRQQSVDLGEHKTWDHGYAETIYSAQSKSYDRAYILAPLGSPLVNGKNYYTAVTRARFGAKLWTQDVDRLVERLESRSGEKTSALEGLGRLDRDQVDQLWERQRDRLEVLRERKQQERADRKTRDLQRQLDRRSSGKSGPAEAARNLFEWLDKHVTDLLAARDNRSRQSQARELDGASPEIVMTPDRGHDR